MSEVNDTSGEQSPKSPERVETKNSNENVRKHVGRVDSIRCYEVTEDELTQLQFGSPDSSAFNIAIALLSSGLSLLPTFFNAKYESDTAHMVFVVLTVFTLLVGLVMVALWHSFKKGRISVFDKIRKRGS
jgi:hypothetical protein